MVRHVFFAPLCIRRFFGAKKACPLLFFFVFFSYILFSLVACTDSSDPETVVYPRDKELYAIFPNDPILGDSVEILVGCIRFLLTLTQLTKLQECNYFVFTKTAGVMVMECRKHRL